MLQTSIGTGDYTRLKSEAVLSCSKHVHEMLHQRYLFQGMSHNHHREHGSLKGKDLGEHQPAAAAPHTDQCYLFDISDRNFDLKTAIK